MHLIPHSMHQVVMLILTLMYILFLGIIMELNIFTIKVTNMATMHITQQIWIMISTAMVTVMNMMTIVMTMVMTSVIITVMKITMDMIIMELPTIISQISLNLQQFIKLNMTFQAHLDL